MYKISVVLPTYNRKLQLKEVLQGLERQTFSKNDFEVVIVSDGSTDGTHEFLANFDTSLNLTWVQQKNSGAAATRNNGYRQAQGKLVLFIDDDVVPHEELLKQHYQSHLAAEMPHDLVVIGPMLTPEDHTYEPWVEWEQEMLYKQYEAMDRGDWTPTARQFYTGNSSIPLTYLKESGGFDESFLRAEDVELAFRLADKGATFAFNKDAIGYHYASRSYASWANIPYSYGRNDVIFTQERGQTWLVPTIMKEYKGRHALIRKLNELCLDRALISNTTQLVSRAVAQTSHLAGLKSISRAGFSLIFNIRHYQGISDQLGGRDRFFQLLSQHG
ncbi:MAG: glycosyltransferase family 2 protein [Anaerolineae bacterium]